MTAPRVALIISGLPRFRADTDTLIYNLQNAEFIDWYISFWKHKPITCSEYDAAWQRLSDRECVAEIRQRLPPTHRIRFFEWVDPNSMPPMPRDYPAFYNYPINCWQQYSILKRVNEARLNFVRVQDWEYDLVVRGRADAGSDRPIDLAELDRSLKPTELHMPNNQRQGPLGFCDHWAVGRPATINALCSVVDQFDIEFQRGCPYNAEYMVGNILSRQGIYWPATTWNSTLKSQGRNDHSGAGMFYPDEGRWKLNI
jgi:hypothetical protein